MHMVQVPTRWTAEMVRALPDDRNRYEVIEGDLIVSPGPSWIHQRAVVVLTGMLRGYLRSNRIGLLLSGPADIEFNEVTQVQPDIFVVPRGAGSAPRQWDDVRQLLLVVEVISPSSARNDRLQKRELYLQRGAPEYWIVDVDATLIERWRQGDTRPEIMSDSIEWRPPNAQSPFLLNLAEYFAEVVEG
jgi:Uma2 family endonuclease